MATVFISYRRADAGDMAGRLADRLKTLPQVDEVFLDVESISFGEDFADKIANVIRRSDICLILIGPEWHGPQSGEAGPRIKEDGDFVHMEAAMALAGDIRVMPVLLHGAGMPSMDVLPDDLSALPRLNAFPVRTEFFGQDAELLFDQMFGADREKPGVSPVERVARRGVGALMGGGLAVFFGIVGLVILNLTTGKSLDALFDYQAAPTFAVMAGVPVLGAILGGLFLNRR